MSHCLFLRTYEIRRLVKLDYPTGQLGFLEDLTTHYLIDALAEAESRWHIQQSRPRSLDEAVRVAVELEAFHVVEKHCGANKKTVRVLRNSKGSEIDQIVTQENRLRQTKETLSHRQQMRTVVFEP